MIDIVDTSGGRNGRRARRGGFALVVTMALLVLLVVVAVGMLGISAISLRGSGMARHQQVARDNARLALMMAIGELQRELGPDRRVSATAGILASEGGEMAEPHWTGVWSTTMKDGGSVWVRDAGTGGLVDRRVGGQWAREAEARAFLVSGNEGAGGERFLPAAGAGVGAVEVVGSGTLGGDAGVLRQGRVQVPVVAVSGANAGHYGWWVGDLGVKAHIAAGRGQRGPAWPVMAQRTETGLVDGGLPLAEADKPRAVTNATSELLPGMRRGRMNPWFHHLTTESAGVMADARDGGLKRDLTTFLAGDGKVVPLSAGGEVLVPGLTDDDPIVGPANEDEASLTGEDLDGSRYRRTAPRFGLLRAWAAMGGLQPGGDSPWPAVPPKPEPDPKPVNLVDFASANLAPASIADLDSASLAPVVVEASTYSSVSFHPTVAGATLPYQVRLHIYPRVTLWNPYNVALRLPRSMVMLQVNGRKESRMQGVKIPEGYKLTSRGIWFFGGRSTEFDDEKGVTESKGYKDPYVGCFYFSLPSTDFKPGECLVFSAARAAEYDDLALDRNELSCEVGPDPARGFSISSAEKDGGISFRPTSYWEGPPNAWELMWVPWGQIKNQADDYRFILKGLGNRTSVGFNEFDALPQIAYVSASLQYGAGREPRVSWAETRPMSIEETDRIEPRPTLAPDVRTRQGIRLRWFQEHPSNQVNSGSLSGTAHFEEAMLATWNPRAAYAFRTPWENIAGQTPSQNQVKTGDAVGGPWFFGIYTRDLYDQDVSWGDYAPVLRGGRYHGNPFGQPVEGAEAHVLFEVPRRAGEVLSLADFRHAKLSEFVWHPSMPLGNSLVDPRCGQTRTVPEYSSNSPRAYGGWNPGMIGWSSDAQRSLGSDEWATFGRALAQNYAESDNLVYDLSFEVNRTVWDRYFLSSGSPAEKAAFAADPAAWPLPNRRWLAHPFRGRRPEARDLTDFHRAASVLMAEGAFNVNSTSVEAWKAVLAATRGSGEGGGTVFPRLLDPPAGDRGGAEGDADKLWAGRRVLSDQEVDKLAAAVVVEVKRRGPFLGLADFVNRRLGEGPDGRAGALQAAIDAAGLNATVEGALPLDNGKALPDYQHPDNIQDPTLLDQRLKPSTRGWGAPGHLTQGDVLGVIGPVLAARSDTFVVRAYGDASDAGGKVVARVWCEAVVQRLPEPVAADAGGLNPLGPAAGRTDFGRKFAIRRFRWLNPAEV